MRAKGGPTRIPPPPYLATLICVAKCTFIHLSLSFAYSSSASFCERSKIQSQEIKEIQRLIVSKWDLFKSYTDKIFKEIHSELIDSFVYIELTICSAQSQSWEFHKKRSWYRNGCWTEFAIMTLSNIKEKCKCKDRIGGVRIFNILTIPPPNS